MGVREREGKGAIERFVVIRRGGVEREGGGFCLLLDS